MSQKNEKKSPRRKYHIVTSLKIDVIEKYYYIRKKNLTENNNSNNNWKSSKLSKSVTENMGVSLTDASRHNEIWWWNENVDDLNEK